MDHPSLDASASDRQRSGEGLASARPCPLHRRPDRPSPGCLPALRKPHPRCLPVRSDDDRVEFGAGFPPGAVGSVKGSAGSTTATCRPGPGSTAPLCGTQDSRTSVRGGVERCSCSARWPPPRRSLGAGPSAHAQQGPGRRAREPGHHAPARSHAAQQLAGVGPAGGPHVSRARTAPGERPGGSAAPGPRPCTYRADRRRHAERLLLAPGVARLHRAGRLGSRAASQHWVGIRPPEAARRCTHFATTVSSRERLRAA